MSTNTDPEATMTVEELVDGVERCIQFHMHQLFTDIRRREEVHELCRRGPSVLEAIGKHINKRFPEGTLPPEEGAHDFFMGWIMVIILIKDKNNLPPSPYPKDTPYFKQDMRQWVTYCFENATKES